MGTATAQAELKAELEAQAQAIAPVCKGCGEYVPSETTENVGYCFFHGGRVLAHDKGCSTYYPDVETLATGGYDEF